MKFHTIGYGGRRGEELVALLLRAGVRTVVDVRLRPDRSAMGIFARAKDPAKGIEALLSAAGIGYVSLIELGNVFVDLPGDAWVARYRRLLQDAGELLTERLREVPPPWCLLCAERRVAECHRRIIADYLESGGAQAEHIE